MPQIFPKKANKYPLYALIGVLLGGAFLTWFIWYYFSPRFTDVGYVPDQPVPYSHRLHVGELGLDCQYCHTNVTISPHANVPTTETCMQCHTIIKPDSPLLAPVRESAATGKPVEWVNVHMLPDYANFNHSIHVNVGVGCETCHGRVDLMDNGVMQMEPLSMGWCLECHRNPEKYLRPPEEVTTMGYKPPADFIEQNLRRIKEEGINPPETCSACHY